MMMVYEGLEFHNVECLKQMNGMRLERFPEKLEAELGIKENYKARFRSKRACGCEIRFVTEAPFFDLCLTAAEADMNVLVYCGDMLHAVHTLKAGVSTVIHEEYPEMYRQVDTEKLPKRRFANQVWRIQFDLNASVHFHYLDTYGFTRRPPQKEEKPTTVWAAYGSSITCGSKVSVYSNCYIEQAAQRLGYDVLNKGLSGSCMCEPETARYLAGLQVDVLSLELGVNMMLYFDEESFEERVRTFLQIIKEQSKAKQIYVIDIFLNRAPILKDCQNHYYRHCQPFREIVKQAVLEMNDCRIRWIDATGIAKDFTYLSTDLLHPSDYGHIHMGENLAKVIMKERTRWTD